MDWSQLQTIMAVVLVPPTYMCAHATLRWIGFWRCGLSELQASREGLLSRDSEQLAAIMTWTQAKAIGKEARADKLFDTYINIGMGSDGGEGVQIAGTQTRTPIIDSHRRRRSSKVQVLRDVSGAPARI